MGQRRGARNAGRTEDVDVNWTSASEFFAMGGYGLYVWGAYVVTALCMAIEPVLVAARHRSARQAVSANEGKT
jgi:heme exporter protein D